MDTQAISSAVKKALLGLYGERLAKLILYGSYARGKAHEQSDIDFLVVLKDSKIQYGAEIRSMSTTISGLNNDFNIYISSHPTTLNNYQHSMLKYYQNIRTEGIEV